MIFPIYQEPTTVDEKFYGAATITVRDQQGKEIFSQTVHNRLVDTGETFLLNQAFSNTVASQADADVVGSICIYDDSATTIASLIAETTTAANFDTGNAITGVQKECKTDSSVDTTTTQGKAVIGPLTFTAGTTASQNIAAGGIVNGIGICQANPTDADFKDCATEGILFAIVDTSDVTLASSETVEITYTFDITSSSN